MRQWHFGCNLHSRSRLVKPYRALAVVPIVALVTLCALFSLSAHTMPDAAETSVTRAPHAEMAAPPDEDYDADRGRGTVDLFGNDVNDAVAQYRLDATGSLYEVHSPQTEIPKLGSPKT